ncbi:MAG TPA: sugar phosphate nucleotidyltransferase [Bryobacteraceae bacterium]|nr:sugar phosphate nucleotidyltransferase [Bryobacteraceae bacterium]HXJ39429.1 sugar phosphate nucleotidyltransferase [Bryobacteraceae bacterium]
MSNHYGLILAGGRGTRFWPRSRRRHAKQVLSIVGERSLIQSTVDRLAPLIPPERLWVLTNEHLREEIVRQLPTVPRRQILAEPMQRNTAPAIGLAAQILYSIDRNAVMGVFPSDHVIAKPRRYLQFARAAFQAAGQGKIVVLGIVPRWAETGYGYIEFPRGTHSGSIDPVGVLKFREKPDARTAAKYVAAKRFFWNAGMFFWRAEVLLDALRRYLPKTTTILASLPRFSDRRFTAALGHAFPLCENISIDYAVLERAKNVVGLACDDIGWNDVGSWNAVYELLPKDRDGNVARSRIVSAGSSGNYIDAGNKLVALLGANDLIVVDTPDALLIADRDRAQQVGELVKLLEQNKREDLL